MEPNSSQPLRTIDDADGEDDDAVNFDADQTVLKAPNDRNPKILEALTPMEDDGTGVFGDFPRLSRKWKKFNRELTRRERAKASGRFGSLFAAILGGDDDDADETASEIAEMEEKLRERKYMEGRKELGDTLESVLGAPPFERYVLTRGFTAASEDRDDSDLGSRSVGIFKGVIRIVEEDPHVGSSDKDAKDGKKAAAPAATAASSEGSGA